MDEKWSTDTDLPIDSWYGKMVFRIAALHFQEVIGIYGKMIEQNWM